MLEHVIEAVKQVAREEVMPRYLQVAHERKSDGSLFTQADLSAQESLARLLPRLVNCPLLGEEMTDAQQKALWGAGDSEVWCVDPIDGTSNFVNGIPYFAVSVALMRGGRPVMGVVYDPVADEAFAAERGRGAWLNGVELPIKESVPTMRHAIAEVDFKRLTPTLRQALGRAPPYSSQRNFGASTLEWCYVAAGRFDLYLHGGQKLWDYAAGSLVLDESGGAYSSLLEDDFWGGDPWKRSVIAARDQQLLGEWRSWIRANL